jgi:hypothetical protein
LRPGLIVISNRDRERNPSTFSRLIISQALLAPQKLTERFAHGKGGLSMEIHHETGTVTLGQFELRNAF